MASSTKHEARSLFRYETLDIWKEAVAIAKAIYSLTEKFLHNELFGIISQLRRAIVSIASNIAEGSGGRKSIVCLELSYCQENVVYIPRQRLQVLIRRIHAFKKTV